MFKKIVVLLDGSPLSQSVLPHTQTLTQAFPEAEVKLLHILEPYEKTKTDRLDPIDWQLRKIEAQSFLNALREEWKDKQLEPETILLEGPAARRIIEYIEENEPDLIMFSSHGNSGLSSWNKGSIAQKIIDRASRSFMLIPAYYQAEEPDMAARYQRIVVPLDGSKRAEIVLPLASRLAAEQDATLILVHALCPPPVIQSHTLTPEEQDALEMIKQRNQAKAESYLAQTADQFGSRTITRFISGSNTVDALLNFVNNKEVDLVVMSAHGSSGETSRPYGSVVSSLIAYGNTPLLLIQDLTQDQIKPSQAELKAIDNGSVGRINRTIAYAQPASWHYRR